MPVTDPEILIIGAGVSGLTVGVCLAERGYRARIWAAEPPQRTTSVAAGAMWGPYLVQPLDKVERWSTETLVELKRLAGVDGTGVRLVSGIEASRSPGEPPSWLALVDNHRPCRPEELPPGFVVGWRYTAPIVDMPTYLDYLTNRFRTAGGTIEIRTVDQLHGLAPLVVNCTGVGARDLGPDPSLTATRGQLVVLSNPGIDEFFTEATGGSPELLHIYPHKETVVVGGVALIDDWRLDADRATAQAIIDRCVEVEPRLQGQPVLAERVGLRPTRHEVRVERIEQTDGSTVIHNYGHGGAGVSLSWGCATESAGLVESGPRSLGS